MAYNPTTRGRISGVDEAMKMLEALAKAASSRSTKAVLTKTQAKGFAEIRHAIYGSKYGVSLAEIFRKTRPRTQSGRSSLARGSGTPVKTGRLQQSLTLANSQFSIYSEQFKSSGAGKGAIQVIYGGDPVNPRTGARYFGDVENKFNFFVDGITKFERANTMQKLGEGLAYVFGKALHDHIRSSIKSAKR
jgi:hypothetical protein